VEVPTDDVLHEGSEKEREDGRNFRVGDRFEVVRKVLLTLASARLTTFTFAITHSQCSCYKSYP
jgi:hypothetical protein